MKRLQGTLQLASSNGKHDGLPWAPALRSLGNSWKALHEEKDLHLRRIHHDHPGDFPSTVHGKEELFLLDKRGTLTSAQALRPERMGRHGRVCSWKGWDLHYATHWLSYRCMRLVYLHLFSVSKDNNTDVFSVTAKATFVLTHAFSEANHWLTVSQPASHTALPASWGCFPLSAGSLRHLVRDLLLN